jgi:hypothetical protein
MHRHFFFDHASWSFMFVQAYLLLGYAATSPAYEDCIEYEAFLRAFLVSVLLGHCVLADVFVVRMDVKCHRLMTDAEVW